MDKYGDETGLELGIDGLDETGLVTHIDTQISANAPESRHSKRSEETF